MAKRVTKRDFAQIASIVIEEQSRREKERNDLERKWDEVDRQLAMEPNLTHKQTSDGTLDDKKAWMPELELPNQSQTLEILVADSRRMMSPNNGSWFTSQAALTDKYLERVDFESIITGDENDVPSTINQDNANKIVSGVLSFWQRQYNFFDNVDLINGEAFKYGVGIGRARVATKTVFRDTAKGVAKETQRIPVLFPRSIRDTYLDDNESRMMNEGLIVSPATISRKIMSLEDLKMAASRGSDDPEAVNGGWMARNLKNAKPDKHGNIEVLEWEGDMVVPRSSGSLFLPNVIVTVCKGESNSVIRLRFSKFPFHSYIPFPYHRETLASPYSTSPLLKGLPIQTAASDALNRMMIAAALNAEPPIQYDSDDMNLAQTGGPEIFPGALWGTLGDIKPAAIGNVQQLFALYQGLLQQYADVTGVNAPRLGAQTVSHTTAFAKDAELQRGTIRTVDYVNSTLEGPLTQWLNMAWHMGKEVFSKSTIYIDEYKGYVDLQKKHLPDIVTFMAAGSANPAQEAQKQNTRIQSLQLAIQMEQLRIQAAQGGVQTTIDFEGAIEYILRQGEWSDVDSILNSVSPAEGLAGQPGVAGAAGGVATAPGAALQALSLASQG